MQIVLFLIFILVIILVFAVKKDELSTKTKTTMMVSILVIIILGTVYELNKNANAQESREKVNAFLQGKTLLCNNIEVSKKDFDYVSGTQTFVPLSNNYEHKGLILEVSKCTIK
jgi:energy-coupling factor transporter transmembrane protein EcfT